MFEGSNSADVGKFELQMSMKFTLVVAGAFVLAFSVMFFVMGTPTPRNLPQAAAGVPIHQLDPTPTPQSDQLGGLPVRGHYASAQKPHPSGIGVIGEDGVHRYHSAQEAYDNNFAGMTAPQIDIMLKILASRMNPKEQAMKQALQGINDQAQVEIAAARAMRDPVAAKAAEMAAREKLNKYLLAIVQSSD